ncbi:hypothetical protein LF817_02585 [Halobacillus sp. A1]|uniref:hypothetical protein n=1 Tax=Halobacillus sp. A1 TaxID=2880262 RepID=UPI0020A63C87|nr:hypothetical protein [Halobacillus sp. A1]MCP3030225.1 hypothetical protein [Halobacillus sp. A1]
MRIMMIAFALLATLTISACSSGADLSIESLKENYPESFGTPVEDNLSSEEQETLGLPSELPFESESIEASVIENEAEIHYQSRNADELTVTTIYNPGNVLQETETRMTLNSGSIAGVDEGEAAVFVEWFDDEDGVIYQMAYSPMEEENRLEKAIDIANSI